MQLCNLYPQFVLLGRLEVGLGAGDVRLHHRVLHGEHPAGTPAHQDDEPAALGHQAVAVLPVALHLRCARLANVPFAALHVLLSAVICLLYVCVQGVRQARQLPGPLTWGSFGCCTALADGDLASGMCSLRQAAWRSRLGSLLWRSSSHLASHPYGHGFALGLLGSLFHRCAGQARKASVGRSCQARAASTPICSAECNQPLCLCRHGSHAGWAAHAHQGHRVRFAL